MGYDAYSYVVYGITVNRKKLERKERKRACTHNTNEKGKFCQECGKPVWIEETVSILDNIREEADGKLSYFTESGDSSRDPEYDFMIGFKLGKTGYNKNRDVVKQPTEEMKQKLLDFIAENNLKLTEKDIEMTVYTYHSY